MDFHSTRLAYRGRRMELLHVALILIKILKVSSFFAAYDILRNSNPLNFLIVLKLVASLILLPVQRPFSASRLKFTEWVHIIKYSFVRVLIDALWIEGLILCGPFRFILLFEHSELLVLAAASTFFFGSQCTKKTRGAVFFVIGVICVAFFDHDYTHGDSEHPEGAHKSFLIHHVYEMFINFGFSDHKVGVLVLIGAVCLDSGLATLSRTLVASIGGAKRLHSLSALISFIILIPMYMFTHFYYETSIYTKEPSDLLKMIDNVDSQITSDDSSNVSSQGNWIFWMVCTSVIHVIDFYMTSLVSGRLGAHSVTRVAKLVVVVTGLIFSFFWVPSTVAEQIVTNGIRVHSFLLQHQMSAGLIVAVICILYASDLLTTTKSGYGPDGNSSGHFIGYSMAGLPLFTAGQTPTHGSALLANPEEVGLWYHLRETFHGILTGKASRRIFAFLCLNLAFTFVELFYGVWTNSLGLISDGFHMLFDSAALVVGLYAAVVSHWKPTRIFSYGYNSAEILSGFVNALFLLVISASVFVNAVARIHQPPDIKTDKLLAVSILGLFVNIVGVVALGHAHSHGGGSHGHSHGGGSHGHSHGGCGSHGHSHAGGSHGHSHDGGSHGHSHQHKQERSHSHDSNKSHSDVCDEELHYGHTHGHEHQQGSHKAESEDANLRGVYLHVLADTLGSVSVIFSSFLVSTYGWNIADPICSMFIACVIGYSAMPLLNDTLGLLTLKVPDNFHSQLLVKKILQVGEVVSVSNPFIWTHTHTSVCVCLTVRINSNASEQILLRKVKDIVGNHFSSIAHLTIQIEKEDFEYHTQAMGLNLSVVGHYPKSLIKSSVIMNGTTPHHSSQHNHLVTEPANLLSVKDV
ncbi:unnamed protein product [Trichobilharzia szidati]|nr:unnamed protein product [Trichobilharzia szidati]